MGVLVGSTVGVWGVGAGDEAHWGHIGCPWGSAAAPGVPHGRSPFAPPGRYLRLRPRGFLRPLPRGPALPAAAAPLLQRQPAPAAPGRLPLTRARRPPVLSASISIPSRGPGGTGATSLGTPPSPGDAPPLRSPRPHPKKSRGVGRGPPKKNRRASGRPGRSDSESPRLVPPHTHSIILPPPVPRLFF